MSIADVLAGLQTALGVAVAAAGLMFMLGGAIGMLRFPDFYTRLHAQRAGDVVGGVLVVLGLAIMSNDAGVSARLMLLAALVAALGPTLSYVLAHAAHAGGLAPIAGRYTAPRPGARRQEKQ